MLHIELDGPGKNALSSTILVDLRDRLRDAGDAPVLLTGAGDAFSAGLDLREVAGFDHAGMIAFLDLLEEVVGLLYHHPGPTVSWIGGHAIAGGCVLALATDQRICADTNLRMGLNEVALGLQFPPRTLEVVRRQTPAPSHARVLLGAGLFDARTALALGLVDALGDLDDARKLLTGLARHPREAYAATKKALRPSTEIDADTRQAFLDGVVPTWTSPALKERLLAVLQRKK